MDMWAGLRGQQMGQQWKMGWGEDRSQGDSGQRTQKTARAFSLIVGPWQRGDPRAPLFLPSLGPVDFQLVVGGQR